MTLNKKLLLGFGLALLLFAGTACGAQGDSDSGGEKAKGQKQSAAPKPDLKGLPDVVATVNGHDISKAEFSTRYELQFQQVASQPQPEGGKLDQDKLKKQTVEGMVGTELLLQESAKRGYKASAKDVDAALDELVKQNGLKSADEFFAAVKKQGTDEKEVRSQIAQQVKVDKLLAKEAGDTKPTEKEVKALYDQAIAQQKQSGNQSGEAPQIPPFDKVKPQLEQQVKAEKESKAAEALVKSYRADAKVKINI